MTKASLRQLLREEEAPSRLYMRLASAQIAHKVLQLPEWKKAKSVFIYVSTPQEVDTHPLLAEALHACKTLLLPRARESGEMDAVPVSSLNCLEEGLFNLRVPPISFPAAPRESIDLAIVPCLAASMDGRRLGHGMGYYDRYLQGCTFPKICLCFSRSIRDDIPHEDRDVLMDRVITE